MSIVARKNRISNAGYLLPDPLQSLEDWLKAQNLDLEELSDIDLYREEIRAKIAFANLDPYNQPAIFIDPVEPIVAQDWLLQRIAAIRKERQRRQEAWSNGR